MSSAARSINERHRTCNHLLQLQCLQTNVIRLAIIVDVNIACINILEQLELLSSSRLSSFSFVTASAKQRSNIKYAARNMNGHDGTCKHLLRPQHHRGAAGVLTRVTGAAVIVENIA